MQEWLSKKQFIPIKEILKKIGVAENQKIGDLGCGTQAAWSFAASRLVGENGTVYAVDIVKSLLHSVESRAKMHDVQNIRTIWSNLEIYGATNIPEHSLDIALLANTLYQSKQQAKMMQETFRLVKEGGKILVVDWMQDTGRLGPLKEHRVNPARIKQIADQLGLTLIQAFPVGSHHFALLFQK